jgi:type II secretory pathway pseudopilin PulG
MTQTQATPNSRRKSRRGQEGYLLIGVLFFVALLSLTLAIAATQITTDIQRDKEEELFDRGMQYERAIRIFYRKLNAYPGNLDALEKTNNIRFLRKRYKDPITGSDTWRLIHMGEAKLKPMGFFGEPIANTGNAGTNVLGGTNNGGGNTNTTNLNNSNNSTTPGTNNSTTGGSTSGSTPSSTAFSGGGAIIGVSSMSTRQSIREYRQQKHYNEWEFVYDPIVEQMIQQPPPTSVTTGTSGTSGMQYGNPTGGASTTTSTTTTP